MPRSALLLVNPDKPEAAAAATEIRRLISLHGRLTAELPADESPLPANAAEADVIVVLGGDGTLLSQSRRCLGLNRPVLGVNFGRVGFMAEFDLPALVAQAPQLFGDAPLHTHAYGLIEASIIRRGASHPTAAGIAINEVVVTSGPPYKMIQAELTINGRPGPVMNGDGLIVSTPLGSTAYNLSVGGPIVAPTVDAWCITPIAAFSLAFRPIIVESACRLDILVSRANGDHSDEGTTLVFDGQVQERLRTGDHMVLQRHAQDVHFVENTSADYWSRLIGKLGWAAPPRARPS